MTLSPTNELLKIENLSLTIYRYEQGLHEKRHYAIRDFELTVNEGEIIAVIGASGSGKSLLASAILGIEPPNSLIEGTMIYKGKPLNRQNIALLLGKEFMLIPQMVHSLNPLMRIGKQIEILMNGRNKRSKIKEVLERVGLTENVINLYPHELSGGMTRRVFIAMVLASEASFIIADEPTTGLDSNSTSDMLSELKILTSGKKGMIFITHDLKSAIQIADRIAVFYGGTTVEITCSSSFEGDGSKLAHPYTKALWNSLPENSFEPLTGTQPLSTSKIDGCAYFYQCSQSLECCERVQPEILNTETGMVRCFNA